MVYVLFPFEELTKVLEGPTLRAILGKNEG